MKNPIEQFFPVEERPDGVYVKVTRPQRDSLSIDVVVTTVERQNVMNFDTAKFRDVVQRARGAFEKIGPLFEYFDLELENFFQLSITPSNASLKISSAFVSSGKKLSDKIIVHYLKSKNVTVGLNFSGINQLLIPDNINKFITVAESIAPVKGEDARIEYKLETNREIHPLVRENGSVDYRNIESFVPISKGQVLAEKHPALPGKDGISVTGEPIPSQAGNDLKFASGKNTEISADGRFLIASVAGVLFQDNGLYNVKELLQVEKDVDFSVGNIKYSGDVMINGNVLPGFIIEAEGNVHIKGQMEASQLISRNGSVTVDKGIIGKGSAIINAKNGVKIGFAQDCKILTEGVLTAERFLLHCECTCKSLEMEGPNSNVIGCNISAEMQMLIKNVGNEQESSTRLHLFDKNKVVIEKKIKELSELECKLSAEMEPIQKQLSTKASLLKKSGDEITARMRDEVKKWIEAYNNLNQKIKYVNQKKEELCKELEKPKIYTGFIKIPGTAFPVTEIDLYGVKMLIQQPIVNKKFHLSEKGIVEQEG